MRQRGLSILEYMIIFAVIGIVVALVVPHLIPDDAVYPTQSLVRYMYMEQFKDREVVHIGLASDSQLRAVVDAVGFKCERLPDLKWVKPEAVIDSAGHLVYEPNTIDSYLSSSSYSPDPKSNGHDEFSEFVAIIPTTAANNFVGCRFSLWNDRPKRHLIEYVEFPIHPQDIEHP
jgi:hypothetical protein